MGNGWWFTHTTEFYRAVKNNKKTFKFTIADMDTLQKQCWMRNVAKGYIQGTILHMFKLKINALWINICIEKYKTCTCIQTSG